MKNFLHKRRTYRMVGLGVMCLAFSFLLITFTQGTKIFKTSVLEVPEHAPFDGTVYPIQKVPDWVGANVDNKKVNYGDLKSSQLIDIPYYDPSELKIDTDSLKWGDPTDNAIRNAKLTYSVPYLGTYLLDGHEGKGSHPAVDIRVPKGTPVYAMANGVVVTAKTQDTGFGNHIVVKHVDVPSYENKNVKTDYYSSYSHMASLIVKSGDVVKKGQKIGYSGESGTATTPHLHFQIDNAEAPWHPFWPFTWAEASDAGLDFFTAINAGLGKSKAQQTTINPLNYVQAHLDGTVVVSNDTQEVPTETNSSPKQNKDIVEDVDEVDLGDGNTSSYVASLSDSEAVKKSEAQVNKNSAEKVVEKEEPVVVAEPDPVFEFEVASKYYVGENAKFKLYSTGFAEEVILKSDRGNVTPNNAILKFWGFEDGVLEGRFRRMTPGRDRLEIEYDGETFYSDWFDVVEDEPTARFTDVPVTHSNYEAIEYLASEGVINGYPDQSFKPNQVVSRVEALKFILAATGKNLSRGELYFTDISDREWYYEYLYTAYNNEIVNGYDDGTFRPANTVVKAEFFKMLYNALGSGDLPLVAGNPYSDVPQDSWFAPYVQYAKDLGVVDRGLNRFTPAENMTRAEVAEAMYRLMRK